MQQSGLTIPAAHAVATKSTVSATMAATDDSDQEEEAEEEVEDKEGGMGITEQKTKKSKIYKKSWCSEEDSQLMKLIAINGTSGKW